MNYKIPVEFIIQTENEIKQEELDKYDRTIQKLFPPWELERAKAANASIVLTITKGMRYYAEANSNDKEVTDMIEVRLRRLVYLLGV